MWKVTTNNTEAYYDDDGLLRLFPILKSIDLDDLVTIVLEDWGTIALRVGEMDTPAPPMDNNN